MRFVYDNLAVLHVALVVSLTAWLFGGTQSDILLAYLPWAFLLSCEVLLFFPQKRGGESTFEARARTWAHLKRDPLLYVSLALLILLAIPFVNNGLCRSCDRALVAAGCAVEPPIPFLPFCVNRLQHLNVYLWFATALSLALVVRHALSRRGKRLLLELIVWNGFLLAVLGFVQTVTEAPGPLWKPFTNVTSAGTFFSTFGYPNMAGDYFTTLFAVAIALWRRSDDEAYDLYINDRNEYEKHRSSRFFRRHYHLVHAAIFFCAAVNTLSRAAMILVTVLSAVFFVHAFLSFARRMTLADRVRKGTIALGLTALVVFFMVRSVPDSVQSELDTLNTDAVLTRVTGKGQYHARVATEIWKDNVLFGCGGWGYKHFSIPKMTIEERKNIQSIGGINVHNDYLQFLAEHGLVGFGLMVAAVILLLVPVASAWRQLYRNVRFVSAEFLPARPVALFVLPASVFAILAGLLATLVHSFGDCPLRSAAVLVLFFVLLSALPGFLPGDAQPSEENHHHASR